MKLSHVIFILLFISILAMSTHFAIDTDTWWHLKAGEWMVENSAVITSDPFSFTRGGEAWQYPGVAIQVGMFLIYDWFGPGGLNLWTAIMITLIFFIVWRMCEGNELVVAALVILGAFSSAIYWNARPYLMTFLLFALSYYILDKYTRSDTGNLWLLPILMVIWVNSHGGFLAGFILMVPFLVDSFFKLLASRKNGDSAGILAIKKFRHLLIVTGLMFVGSLFTPHGIALWELPFTTFTREAEQLLITEWQSPDFHDSALMPFAVLLLSGFIIFGLSRKILSLSEVLLVAGFGYLSLVSMRNILFFSVIAPPIYSRYLKDVLTDVGDHLSLRVDLDFSRPPTRVSVILNWVIVIICVGVGLIHISTFLPVQANIEDFKERFPVDAVEFLKEEMPEGQMFNTYNFGGYLIWALEEYPVFVDGRADLFGDEIILPFYRVLTGSEEWVDVFEKWGINFVFVEPKVDLVQNLKHNGWTVLYEDDLAIIIVSP